MSYFMIQERNHPLSPVGSSFWHLDTITTFHCNQYTIYVERHTFGRCYKKFPMYMFPNNTEYLQQYCRLQCQTELSWSRCECLITPLQSHGKAFAKIYHDPDPGRDQYLKANWNALLGCGWRSVSSCIDKLWAYIDEHGLDYLCSYCKPQCEETEFNYQKTISRFSSKGEFPDNVSVTGFDEQYLSTNFLLLNVHFRNTLVNVIAEEQMYTSQDLVVFIGNNIGLFLGMSFISLFEIWDLLIHQPLHYITQMLISNSSNIFNCFKNKARRKSRVKVVRIQDERCQWSSLERRRR